MIIKNKIIIIIIKLNINIFIILLEITFTYFVGDFIIKKCIFKG